MVNDFRVEAVSLVRAGRRLLDGVCLALNPGEMLAVMGENGAGKSTLLKVFAGDIRPDAGEVVIAGRRRAAWPVRDLARLRAVLPQHISLSFAFTVLEVVLLGRSAWNGGFPGPTDRRHAMDALGAVDAAALAERRFTTLSGGERARVMLARAFAQVAAPWQGMPRFLLLDEPVAALDIAHQHRVLRLIRALSVEQGLGVLVVLHDLNLALRYAHRLALLREGRLMAQGVPAEVLTEETVRDAFGIETRRVAHPDHGGLVLLAA
jgi:iron complex transport system ATP-binding protein